MDDMNRLLHGFCEAMEIERHLIRSDKRTGEIVAYRVTFAAVVLKVQHPDCLRDPEAKNPGDYLAGLSEILDKRRSAVSKVSSNARFYYRTYPEFRKQVDELEKRISHVVGD